MKVGFMRGNQDSVGYKQQTLEEGGSNCSPKHMHTPHSDSTSI